MMQRGVHQQQLHPAGWNAEWSQWVTQMQQNGGKINETMVRQKMTAMLQDPAYSQFFTAGNAMQATENYLVRQKNLAKLRRLGGRAGSVDARVLALSLGATIVVAGSTFAYDQYVDLGWSIGVDLATVVGLVRALQLADADNSIPATYFKIMTQGRIIIVSIQPGRDSTGEIGMYITLFEIKDGVITDLLSLVDSIRKGYRVYNTK